jgi:hypothetical protein
MQTRLDGPELGMRGVDHDVVVGSRDDARCAEDEAPFLPAPSLAELLLTVGGMLSQPGRLGAEKTS